MGRFAGRNQIKCDDGDRAAKIIKDALGIESASPELQTLETDA